MSLRLSGSAFITGAAQGIGLHTAAAFARYGVRQLALSDINDAALARAVRDLREQFPEVEIVALHADVRLAGDVAAAVGRAREAFGRLDVAVNNAGVRGPTTDTTDAVAEADWAALVDVDLSGVWRCQKEELRVMRAQEDRGPRDGRGRIINVASIFGLFGPPNGMCHTAYSAAKHGVVGLTRADAVIFGHEGIRINAVCPGFTNTEMVANILEEAGETRLSLEIQRSSLGRVAEVDEIADCIAFLASPLSSYMQGATLVADGGFTLT